jgi:hypothetical protein
MTKEIPLTKGKIALVDDEDYARVIALGAWRAHKPKHVWYAQKSIGPRIGRQNLEMHRFIMDAPAEFDVDHRNGDGLNNQRYNLRLSTRSQNLANRIRCKSQTGYRGVQPEHKSDHFIAQITVDRRRIRIGNFATATDAARAYNEAALKYYGEFARLNIIPEEN